MNDRADGLRRRALVFVGDVERPRLDEGDRHHLERVLRLRPGTPITVAEPTGRWRIARLGPEPEPAGPVEEAEPARDRPVVAFTPTKGERPEWVVQKLTELGVARIVVLEAERSVVRWDPARAERQLERWHRVAREACMQSRRLRLPEIEGIVAASQVLARPAMAVAEPAGRPPTGAESGVAVGPEGGWTAAELAVASDRLALPGGILRAETAAVAAATVLVALGSGLVRAVERC